MFSKEVDAREIKSYKRRFWILFLFSTLSATCGLAFHEYVAMADTTVCFYSVSLEAVNWTVFIYSVVYVVLVFPVSWFVERMGLRKTVILASVGNVIYSILQFFTVTQDSFTVVMVSMVFTAIANVFVLAVPPCLAATWFPKDEISRACAVGVFGNQVGLAGGFVFFPYLVPSDCKDRQRIANGKTLEAIVQTVINVVLLVLIVFTFQNEPKKSPSFAQAEKKNAVPESSMRSLVSLMKNKNFLLILMIYGLLGGTFFANSSLLERVYLEYIPGDKDIGWIGLIFILTGLVGAIIAGNILDKSHKFKFFLTSYLPVGFDFAVEVTYPESEITSAGLLNSSLMIFGYVLTEIGSYVLEMKGAIACGLVTVIALIASGIFSALVSKDYRRLKKNTEEFTFEQPPCVVSTSFTQKLAQ